MSRTRIALAVACVCAFACSCAPHVTRETDLSCPQAAIERARVGRLLAEGRLDRATRVIARADALCPSTAPESWAALLDTLVELGRTFEASQLAARIERDPDAPSDAEVAAASARRSLTKDARPYPHKLFLDGLEASVAGRRSDAQRLFDRAIVAMERAASDTGGRAVSVRLEVIEVSGRAKDAVLSPDKTTVALLTGDGVDLRDLRSGELLHAISQRFGNGMWFAPDGLSVYIHWHDGTGPLSGDTVRYDVRDGRHLGGWTGLPPAPGPSDPPPEAFTWSQPRASGTEVGRFGATIRSLEIASDGGVLLTSASDGSVRRWNASTGRLEEITPGEPEPPIGTCDAAPGWLATSAADCLSIALSPGRETLALARRTGAVEIWDVDPQRLRHSLDEGRELPVAMAFHPAGDIVFVGYQEDRGNDGERRFDRSGALRLWSTVDGALIGTMRGVDGTSDSYVMTDGADGRIEFFGESGRRVVQCRAGAFALPFEACAERFEVDGLLARSVAGDRAYLDP